MAATADKVIRIALDEVGYLEKSWAMYKAKPKIIYEKNIAPGYDNVTKYGKEMHDIYPQVMDFPAAWCDSFVAWCFYKAYGVTTAKSLLHGNFDDYTVASADMYSKHRALDQSPKVGDQIFFSRNGRISGIYHTGLVVGVDASTIVTVEGNTSAVQGTVVANGGGVARKVYSRSSKAIKYAYFGHPKYDVEESSPAAENAQEGAKSNDQKGFESGHEHGQKLTVTASSLNLRIKPGTASDCAIITEIPKGKTVIWYGYYEILYGVKWLYVQYGGRTGWVSSTYLSAGTTKNQ